MITHYYHNCFINICLKYKNNYSLQDARPRANQNLKIIGYGDLETFDIDRDCTLQFEQRNAFPRSTVTTQHTHQVLNSSEFSSTSHSLVNLQINRFVQLALVMLFQLFVEV